MLPVSGEAKEEKQDTEQGWGEVHNYKRLFHGAVSVSL